MSSANPPPPPDIGDLWGLAHGLRQLFEIAASTLGDDTQPGGGGYRRSCATLTSPPC